MGAVIAHHGLLMGQGAGSTTYLDQLATTPRAVLSLKKLVSTATVAIRVRRSSDNTEQDIGFSGNALDTASLATFVGSNSAFVTKIYDQTGNGFDAVQATSTLQPRIVNAGTYDGKLVFDGTDDYFKVTSLTMGTPQLHVYSRAYAPIVTSVSKMYFELTEDYSGGTGGGAILFSNTFMRMGSSNPGASTQRRHNEFGATTPAAMAKLSALWDRSIVGQQEEALWVDGVNQTVTTVTSPATEQTGNFPTANFYMGARATAALANALQLETLVAYNADTSALRAAIEGAL